MVKQGPGKGKDGKRFAAAIKKGASAAGRAKQALERKAQAARSEHSTTQSIKKGVSAVSAAKQAVTSAQRKSGAPGAAPERSGSAPLHKREVRDIRRKQREPRRPPAEAPVVTQVVEQVVNVDASGEPSARSSSCCCLPSCALAVGLCVVLAWAVAMWALLP